MGKSFKKNTIDEELKLSRMGESRIMNCGIRATIVEYTSSSNIRVRFDTGESISSQYQHFIRGGIKPPIKDRVGESVSTKYGETGIIIKYNNSLDIEVEMSSLNGVSKINTQYSHFKSGKIRSKFATTVYGIGCLGDTYKDVHQIKSYKHWSKMLQRCYSPIYQEKQPTYKNCTVDKQWHNFTTFNDWFNKNYYEVEDEDMQLDKDILIKGNKTYGENTCIFVPRRVNSLFTKRESKRNSLPIGVYFNNSVKKLSVCCGDGFGKNTNLGECNTPTEGFLMYKRYKESVIKLIADSYNGKIPMNLYSAMINYEVEITD